MGGLPAGVQVDIEFTAGAWTNVTAFVDAQQGIQTRFGRTNSAGTPQVATASLRLENFDGRFTPNNAASPYYPNVQPRKRVRVSYASGASPRFVGYIKQWLPTLDGGQSFVTLSAVDWMDALSRRTLPSFVDVAALAYQPIAYFPMTDGVGSSAPIDSTSRVTLRPGGPFNYNNVGVSFGTSNVTPYADSRTGVTISVAQRPVSSGTFAGFQTSATSAVTGATGSSVIAWITWPAGAWGAGQVSVAVVGNLMAIVLESTAGTRWVRDNAATVLNITGTMPDDGLPHQWVMTSDGVTISAYLDASIISSAATSAQPASFSLPITIAVPNSFASTTSATVATISGVGFYPTALSAAQVLDIYRAGASGGIGATSGARATSVLAAAGVTASRLNIATGQETLGAAVTTGKSVTTALQDVAATEGGGCAAFVDVDGRVRFIDRSFRTTSTVAMTLDAQADLDGGTWQPVLDDLARVNQSTVTRNGGTAQVYTDTTSTAELGVLSDSATSYASTDNAALNLAQWRVTSTAAALRVPQVAVDLLTAQNSAALYTALASVTIGSRVRINNIPNTISDGAGGTVRVFPTTQLDGYVEGWSEQIAVDTYRVTFDLSPVDSPPRGIWQDATYGHWQPVAGSLTLTGTITNSATSLQVSSPGGLLALSTSAGDYPLLIQIDQEVLSISSAPASTVSPQTLTVTRAQQGTFADAHTAGAVVSLWPATTWTL